MKFRCYYYLQKQQKQRNDVWLLHCFQLVLIGGEQKKTTHNNKSITLTASILEHADKTGTKAFNENLFKKEVTIISYKYYSI